jgi:hypothetical protein
VGWGRHHQKSGEPCAQPRGHTERNANCTCEYYDSNSDEGGGERERERERERQESKSDTMHHFSAVDQKGGYDREALVQSRGWDLTGIS